MLLVNTTNPNAVIRYTTDGSEPTESSVEWQTQIACDAPLIKAKAFLFRKGKCNYRIDKRIILNGMLKRLCQNADTAFFYAQSPDFLKPGLCYYPKFSYL